MSQYHANCTKECSDTTKPGTKLTTKVPELPRSEHEFESHHSLLDVLSNSKNCKCEVVARALKSDLHVNIGMSETRELTNNNMLERSAVELQSATSTHTIHNK